MKDKIVPYFMPCCPTVPGSVKAAFIQVAVAAFMAADSSHVSPGGPPFASLALARSSIGLDVRWRWFRDCGLGA